MERGVGQSMLLPPAPTAVLLVALVVLAVLAPLGGGQAQLDAAPAQGVNAWVCRGVECLPPISEFGQLESALDAAGR